MIKYTFAILLTALNLALPTSVNAEYVIGIDDVLEISVLEYDNLHTVATVPADGLISFPYIGNVQAEGKTLDEIKAEISNKLSDSYIKYPVVSISLIKSRSKNFFVYGAVSNPNAYPISDDMTVLKAISVAGGLTPDSLYGKINVRRPGRKDEPEYQSISIDIRSTMEGKSKTGDMLLLPGDIVVVEPSEKFFVYGEVARRGRYFLDDNMTALRAISVSGGLTPGGLYGRVNVRRLQNDKPGYEDIEIDIRGTAGGAGKTGDMPLLPGDIVVIKPNEKFFVYGEVARPGRYLLEDNTTVLKAISMAGGFSKYGSSSRIKVLKPKKEEAGYETIKIDIKSAMNGSPESDMLLHPEDIVVVSEGIF